MLLSTAIVIGFLGSVHCLGMCAPIVWALPDDRSKRWRWFVQRLTYNVGRVMTYALLGAIMGAAGELLSFAGVQQGFSIAIGAFLIIGIFLFKGKIPDIPTLGPLKRFVLWWKRRFSSLISKKSLGASFVLGTLNGLLPCGLVYAALVASISMGTVSGAALYMTLFGLGTFPMMIAAAIFGRVMGTKTKARWTGLAPKFIVVVGILFILRGLNLGIPYLSPHFSRNQNIVECVPIVGDDNGISTVD